MLRHPDDVPALRREEPRLRPRREAWTLDHDHGSPIVHRQSERARPLDGHLAKRGAVRVGERDVRGHRPVVERAGSSLRPIDELIADHELAGLHAGLERADRARPEDPLHPELLHRPEVGPVVDHVRGELVLHAVAGKEGHPSPLHRPDGDRPGRLAVRRVDLEVLDVVEERIEPRATEDSDADRFATGSGAQADFSFVLPSPFGSLFFELSRREVDPVREPFSPVDPEPLLDPDPPLESDPFVEPDPVVDPAFSEAVVSPFSPSPPFSPSRPSDPARSRVRDARESVA